MDTSTAIERIREYGGRLLTVEQAESALGYRLPYKVTRCACGEALGKNIRYIILDSAYLERRVRGLMARARVFGGIVETKPYPYTAISECLFCGRSSPEWEKCAFDVPSPTTGNAQIDVFLQDIIEATTEEIEEAEQGAYKNLQYFCYKSSKAGYTCFDRQGEAKQYDAIPDEGKEFASQASAELSLIATVGEKEE